MYSIWQIKAGDISTKLNRYGTYEKNEIIHVAEEFGYNQIEENNGVIEANSPCGSRIICASPLGWTTFMKRLV